jgi:hypothetical protein
MSSFRRQCLLLAFFAGSEATGALLRPRVDAPSLTPRRSACTVGIAAWLASLSSPSDGAGSMGGAVVASVGGGVVACLLLLLRLRLLDPNRFAVEHADGSISIRKSFYM